MFIISNNDKRKDIGRLFAEFKQGSTQAALSLLANYNVSIEQAGSDLDCAAYVCKALDLPGDSQRLIDLIAQSRNEVISMNLVKKGEDCIARYFDANGQFKHAALYIGDNLFQSKWTLDFLVTHPLENLPFYFGQEVLYSY